MLMSYLGTAKTWLYALVFHFWRPGIWSLRVPPVLLGALTLFLLYRLVNRVCDRRTAFAVTMLLATDATFVLTTTFDWGPVAIQHLAYVAGLLFVVSGYRRQSAVRIGAGFLMFGLGMWDKAIFIWILSGSALATLILFPRLLRQAFSWRNVLAAFLGFSIGASPFIIYNIRNPLKTFQGTAVCSTADVDQKIQLGGLSLAGSAMFGYVVNEPSEPVSRPPRNALERFSNALRNVAGDRRSDLLYYAFLASVLAVPLWWHNRKVVLFALITVAAAWPQMLFTRDAGTGVHHVVLLWPLPHLVIAVTLAETARRFGRAASPVLYAGVGVLCLSNLLVMNQYLYQFARYGPAFEWTDAILPLSDQLTHWKDRHILMTDWGMDPTLAVLHQGDLRTLWNVSDSLSHDLSAEDSDTVRRTLLINGVFLTHTPAFEVQHGAARRLFEVANGLGYERRLLATVSDSFGRPAFEILEFTRGPRVEPNIPADSAGTSR